MLSESSNTKPHAKYRIIHNNQTELNSHIQRCIETKPNIEIHIMEFIGNGFSTHAKFRAKKIELN